MCIQCSSNSSPLLNDHALHSRVPLQALLPDISRCCYGDVIIRPDLTSFRIAKTLVRRGLPRRGGVESKEVVSSLGSVPALPSPRWLRTPALHVDTRQLFSTNTPRRHVVQTFGIVQATFAAHPSTLILPF
jgi:hypothetical protein